MKKFLSPAILFLATIISSEIGAITFRITDLGVPGPGLAARAYGINDLGQVVSQAPTSGLVEQGYFVRAE